VTVINHEQITWPPTYRLRRSSRAKYIRININKKGHLELVLPLWADEEDGIRFLNSKQNWIVKHLKQARHNHHNTPPITRPTELNLLASGEAWQLAYQYRDRNRILIASSAKQCLTLQGPIDESKKWRQALENWLKYKAKIYLPQRLDELSQQHNLPYHKTTIRNQRTRWGSCTPNHTINLNYKLILLPKELADHVMLHELCHTVHLNHSKRFWQLLNRLDKNTCTNELALKQINSILPPWILDEGN